MRESSGRVSTMCVDSCPWSKLELLLATVMVDADLLLAKANVSRELIKGFED